MRREIAGDQPTVALPKRQKLTVESSLGIVDTGPAGHRGGGEWAEIEHGALDCGGGHRLHVVAGHAIEDRVGTGGVIADDATGGGAIGGGGIGAKT